MGCPDLGLALDGPSGRDRILHEEPGLTIVISPQDAVRVGDVVIRWYGDDRGGFMSARMLGSDSSACSIDGGH